MRRRERLVRSWNDDLQGSYYRITNDSTFVKIGLGRETGLRICCLDCEIGRWIEYALAHATTMFPIGTKG